MRLASVAALSILFLNGCTVTGTDVVKTGLFGDDLKTLSDAYESVDKLGNGKVTKKNLENMGFDFNAKNIERSPGYIAFRKIFGDTIFQNALNDPVKVDAFLQEMNQYYAFFIPYKDIMSREDRFYFSRKEIHRTGDDLLILFIFRKEKEGKESDVLTFHDYQYVKVDAKESRSAFAAGLLEVIEKYGGFGSNVKDLIDKLKNK